MGRDEKAGGGGGVRRGWAETEGKISVDKLHL